MTIARSNEGRQTGKPSPSSTRPSSDHALVELIDRILDKGLVIDAWARISLLGIELITIEARIIVASLETYLRYAEAITAVPLLAAPPPTPLAAAPSIPARPTPAPAPPAPVATAPPHAPQVAQAPQHTAPVAPPARSEVEGLPLMAPALQAIVATLQQQLLQATEAQLSAALSPLRQHLQHEMTSALEPVHASLPQQIQQSVEPVRTTVRQEVGRALEPIHGSLVLSSDRSSHGP